MFFQNPLDLSKLLISSFGTHVKVDHLHRIPKDKTILVVSNHRSFMDAPLLMASLGQPIRFACHHYMSKVPGLREVVEALGCFSLDASNQSQRVLFKEATCFYNPSSLLVFFQKGVKVW